MNIDCSVWFPGQIHSTNQADILHANYSCLGFPMLKISHSPLSLLGCYRYLNIESSWNWFITRSILYCTRFLCISYNCHAKTELVQYVFLDHLAETSITPRLYKAVYKIQIWRDFKQCINIIQDFRANISRIIRLHDTKYQFFLSRLDSCY